MIVFDTEVFAKYWLFISFDTHTNEYTIIENDYNKIYDFYLKNKKSLWVGYNVNNYDRYIINELLQGKNPKCMNDFIINTGKPGYMFPDYEYKNFFNFFDLKETRAEPSLKVLEGMFGEDINECEVPFDLARELTQREKDAVIKYCKHDVDQTVLVLEKKKDLLKVKYALCKKYGLMEAGLKLTNAALVADILGAKKVKCTNPFDIDLTPILKIIDCDANRDVIEFYQKAISDSKLGIDVSNRSHVFNVNGLDLKVGWGGVHGGVKNTCLKGDLKLIDATSYYPTIIIRYKLLQNASKLENYIGAYLENIELKKKGTNKREHLKLFLNTASGALRASFNNLYNPIAGNTLCVYGQLLLIDLCRMLGSKIKLLNVNTDGIIVSINEDISSVIESWQNCSKVSLEIKDYKKLYQRDVNSYVLLSNDEIKSKGIAKKPMPLDYNIAIVKEAIFKCLKDNIPVADTIYACKDLHKFQMVVKHSSQFTYHNNQYFANKVFRVFASKDSNDTPLLKVKLNELRQKSFSKVAGLPFNCFVDNSNIIGKDIPAKLDLKWYVDYTLKVLKALGYQGS